jgi:hypothetical protein
MKPIHTTQMSHDELSRRDLIRKAAYTAPAVFVVAAAPRIALGASGPTRRTRPTKPTEPTNSNDEPNNNNDNKNGNNPNPIRSGTVEQALKVAPGRPVEQSLRVAPADGEAVVRSLPNTGSSLGQTDADASGVLSAATSLSLFSAAGAIILRKHNPRMG